MSVPVVIYTTSYCGYCRSAKRLLQTKGITFREVDVTHDQGARRMLVRTTGQTTVPQVFIHEKSIGGFSELAALDRSGKLDELIAEAPPAAGQPGDG